uniref:Exonuclease domain-containing protein n=1 Tax=Bosea sp. NBC_00436 TaxID=2969620 RepID=A0A9E8CSJ5_9HYPH
MSSFIIYDLETTGLEPAWNVPLQAALIHTDEELRPLGELSLRCALPAHIVPSPGALLTTGIRPEQLEQAPMTSLDMLGQIARAIRAWSPATVVGYNILHYDEEVLRHSFFSHLLPPYATQAPGLKRADLLIMLRAAIMLEPGAITIPLDGNGKRSLKLGAVCRANGIPLAEDEAHDALFDARATLALFRLLRERAPRSIALMLANAHKSGPIRLLARGDLICLGGHAALVPAVGIRPNPDNATSWAVADLSIDPAGYLDGTAEEIASLLTRSGPRPMRMVKTNAQPIVLGWEDAQHALPTDRLDDAVYHDRARRIRQHPTFQRHLTAALKNRFADREPSPHHEATLYSGGFLSDADARVCARWHELPWDQRGALVKHMGDIRLQAFANRQMFLHAPECLSHEAWRKGRDWLRERLTTEADVPWLTLPKALLDVAELRASLDPQDADRHAHLDAIESWLHERNGRHQLAA